MNRSLPRITDITDTFLMYIVFAVALGVIAMTAVLMYHWARYAMKDPVVPFMQLIYFLGLCILSAGVVVTIL